MRTDQPIRLNDNIRVAKWYQNVSLGDDFRTLPPMKFIIGGLIREPSLHDAHSVLEQKVKEVDQIPDF